jgi:hypothetical protein
MRSYGVAVKPLPSRQVKRKSVKADSLATLKMQYRPAACHLVALLRENILTTTLHTPAMLMLSVIDTLAPKRHSKLAQNYALHF